MPVLRIIGTTKSYMYLGSKADCYANSISLSLKRWILCKIHTHFLIYKHKEQNKYGLLVGSFRRDQFCVRDKLGEHTHLASFTWSLDQESEDDVRSRGYPLAKKDNVHRQPRSTTSNLRAVCRPYTRNKCKTKKSLDNDCGTASRCFHLQQCGTAASFW